MVNGPILWGGDNASLNLQTYVTTDIIGQSSSDGKNYLAPWFYFNKNPTIGIVTTLTSTGNRTTNTTFWGSSTTSLLSYETAAYLRPPASARIAITGTAGAQFVETPMFSFEPADVGLPMYITFDYSTTGVFASGDCDIVVIRYNSSGVYQATITPTVTNLPASLTAFKTSFSTSMTGSDQYAIRFRSQNAATRTFFIDDLYVGPQQFVTTGTTTASGTYTPTLSSGSGFFSGTATINQFNYSQVGNIVFVTGYVSWTGSTNTSNGSVSLTLPVATANFSNTYQVTGVVADANGGTNPISGRVVANSGAQTASVSACSPLSGTTAGIGFSFSYQIQ